MVCGTLTLGPHASFSGNFESGFYYLHGAPVFALEFSSSFPFKLFKPGPVRLPFNFMNSLNPGPTGLLVYEVNFQGNPTWTLPEYDPCVQIGFTKDL